MKKKIIAVLMTAVIASALAGCGSSSTNESTESAAAATTQAPSNEVAAENEWMNDPTAYMSGITASDYVDLPADYASLTVEVQPVAEVTDEEVEAVIDNQRDLKKELKEIKGRDIVKDGDVVNIDYVGRIDGEEFDGGSDEGYDLIIGSGMFIDGFERTTAIRQKRAWMPSLTSRSMPFRNMLFRRLTMHLSQASELRTSSAIPSAQWMSSVPT